MTKTKAVYLSGPMTGWPEFNRAWFAQAEKTFKRLGWRVFNPHSFIGEKLLMRVSSRFPRLSWSLAMIRDIAILVVVSRMYDCFGMYVHKAYKKSVGASIEVLLAKKLGIGIIEEALH